MRMCDDKEIHSEIFSYIDGTLDAQTAEKIAEHLKGCPDCRRLEREYRRAIQGLRTVFDENALQHITNETLVEYVERPENLTDDVKDDIELHLAMCQTCEQKADMLRNAIAEEVPGRRDTASGRTIPIGEKLRQAFQQRAALSFAAAAVLLIALAAVYWMTIPNNLGPRMEIAAGEDVTWISEATRGTSDLPEISADNGWIHIGVLFYAFFDEERYAIQLNSRDGSILREIQVNQNDYNGYGIPLRIEASSLAAGEYQLILVSSNLETGKTGTPVAYRFRLQSP